MKILVHLIQFLFTCIFLFAGENEQKVTNIELIKNLESISSDDLQEIKKLFKDLFYHSSFAYSIFGDKPMTITNSLKQSTSNELVKFYSIDGYCHCIFNPYLEPVSLIKKRLEIWKKHEHLFRFKDYSLFLKRFENCNCLAIINKKKLKDTFQKNLKLFRNIIDSNLTYEAFLNKILSEDTTMGIVLHKNEGLLGILLGFGKYNSMLFQKREDFIEKAKILLMDSNLYNKKMEKLNSKLQFLHEFDHHIIVNSHCVGFVADPNHEETKQLIEKYDDLTIKINEIYSKDDWFEQTLLQLSSDNDESSIYQKTNAEL